MARSIALRKKSVHSGAGVTLLDAARVPEGYALSTQGITQSLLTAFLACPMRGRLALARWGGETKRSRTRFGSLFHGLLEYTYGKPTPATDAQAELVLGAVAKKLAAEYGTTPGAEGAAERTQQEYDKATALELWCAYRLYHGDDWKALDTTHGQTEMEFALPYGEVVLRGKIDGIMPDRSGKRWLLEHKTHAQIDDEWFTSHLGIDLQVLFYLWVLRAMGKPAIGVKYNVVRNPSIKPAKGEGVALWREKLREHIEKEPAHYFHRYEVRILDEQLDAFESDLYEMLARVHQVLGTERPARYSVACKTPYPCEYLQACSSCSMVGYTQREHLHPELDYWRKKKVSR